MINITMQLAKETKGTYVYQEVDEKAQVVDRPWAKIGSLYIQKGAFERGKQPPRTVSVAITVVLE